MTFEPDFLDLMKATLTYYPFAAPDNYGRSTYGSSVSCPCHITFKTKAMRTSEEENVISTAQVQTPPPGFVFDAVAVPTFTVDDAVTLPDGKERLVLNVTASTDESGVIHHQSLDLT
jgi:hypothetical protein